ncbi:GcvT family protein [Flexivirga caeni]|uniref:FAD-dependent oxidoreductase n=1 Tax=Flexivirga caeni TaxID=2294115 RepID=A0A3M9LVP4_9MICO|nr:FAD-dependent oxidoreductase [Flexivirga caeni]RNI17047.1 FAD-dependent oxidoreductase [Flexivirga caeni]
MTDPISSGLPDRAHVVIVGGGVIGTSVAYHLTRLGWTDVVLLEQGRLSCGTTWHAAGLVGPLRASESGTRLVQYSAQLYAELEAETGLATGYRNVGGLVLARTPDRMVQLARTAASGAAYGLRAELIDPDQAKELWPPMQVGDLLGALWLPGDGKVNPADLTQSLAKGARQRGTRIFEGVRVTGFATTEGPRGRRVTGVRTDQGSIEADVVVNCAGQWAKALGDLVGVTIPLHSAEHFYVVTEQVDGTHPDLPIMRDQDGWTYFKEEVGGLVVGGFEPNAKPWVSPDQIPYPFEFQLLPEDWDHFQILMDEALLRVPSLEHTGIRKFYNGPESFTPDNQFLLGEAPELDGFFVGCGFNSVGIASAGGAGRALAEWIVAGEPQDDLVAVDVRRFAPFHGETAWLRSRVAETLGNHYAIPWPNLELTSGRPQRLSALHDRLAAKGAIFGAKMGWERPLVFGPAGASLGYSWRKPNWLDWCIEEQVACRSDVAVFDQTSFSKYEVRGPGALASLQRICGGDVDVPIGRAVYTPWLNHKGTYEADLTVTRTGEDTFFIVSSSATTIRDLDWLRRHLDDAVAVDLTEDYAVLGVMGPRSRALLQALTDTDLSHKAFAFGTSREIALAGVPVRATRVTYVGELGWELYVLMDQAVVYDAISAAGARDAGYNTIEAMRLEKGYRAFPRELNPDYNPVEAGLTFACKLGSEIDFIGREAVLAAKQDGPRRRLVSFVAEDPEVMMWGGELVLRDGQPAGQVTSAAWGATLGAAVGLAYLWRPDGQTVTLDWVRGGRYQVNVGGALVDVRLSTRPLFDPGNERVRG